MTRAFKRHGQRVRMELHTVEVDLLQELCDALQRVLESGDLDDPIMQRLFPSAVENDPDADAELRQLLRHELLDGRLAGLAQLVGLFARGHRHGDRLRVDLEPDEAVLVLGVLNDIRLAIGAQVGIDHLDRDAPLTDDTLAHRLAVMDHLAGLQEQLLAVLDPAAVSVHDDLGPEDLQ